MNKGICAFVFGIIGIFAIAGATPRATSAAPAVQTEETVAGSCKLLHSKCNQGEECCSGKCYVDNDEGKGIWRCGE
jgi:hypothetical protein